MFSRRNSSGYDTPFPGIRQKTISYGEKTLMAEYHLSEGAHLPVHSHHHEQTGYLVSGHITLTIGDTTHDARPGDSWMIPGNTPHHAVIHADSVAVEVFSPVREEFIPKP